MKNTNLFLGSLILCSLSAPSFAGNLANMCAPGICSFNSLDKPSDTAEFFCETSDDVKLLHFANHNVNVGGFDSNGELILKDGDVGKLKTYYFKVSVDPKRPANSVKTVTYNLDGKTKCTIGKGGRRFPFNGFFKLL